MKINKIKKGIVGLAIFGVGSALGIGIGNFVQEIGQDNNPRIINIIDQNHDGIPDRTCIREYANYDYQESNLLSDKCRKPTKKEIFEYINMTSNNII